MNNIPFNTFISLSDIETHGKPFPSSLYSYWKAWVRGPFICGDRAPGTNGLRLFAFNIRSLFQSNSYHRQVFSSSAFVSEEAQEISSLRTDRRWLMINSRFSHSPNIRPNFPVQTLGIIWDFWHYTIGFFGIFGVLWWFLAILWDFLGCIVIFGTL